MVLRTKDTRIKISRDVNFNEQLFSYLENTNHAVNYEPHTYQNSIRCEDSSKWKRAMEEKMQSLKKNDIWEILTIPDKHRVVDCKWIYKLKEGNTPGEQVKYKARLVAKGFTQKEGI
ncbi:hypothetical protein UlMin_027527 [Ulmus minor]